MLGPHSIFSSQRRLFLIRTSSLNFDMLLDNMLLPNNNLEFHPFLICLLIRILLLGRPVPFLLLSSTSLLRYPSTWCLFSVAPSFYEFFLPMWHQNTHQTLLCVHIQLYVTATVVLWYLQGIGSGIPCRQQDAQISHVKLSWNLNAHLLTYFNSSLNHLDQLIQ